MTGRIISPNWQLNILGISGYKKGQFVRVFEIGDPTFIEIRDFEHRPVYIMKHMVKYEPNYNKKHEFETLKL